MSDKRKKNSAEIKAKVALVAIKIIDIELDRVLKLSKYMIRYASLHV